MKKKKDNSYAQFKRAVFTIVQQLRISPEYRHALLHSIRSTEDRARVIRYAQRPHVSFATVPVCMRKVFDEHCTYVQKITAWDQHEREKKTARRRNARVSRVKRSGLRVPIVIPGFPPDDSRAIMSRAHSNTPDRGYETTYGLLVRFLRHRKNPDDTK